MFNTIWYISKYAVPKAFGFPTRQYFFSKHFSERERDVTLISSRSSMLDNFPDLKFRNHIEYKDGNLKCVVINGPIINMGFNFKRILSWVTFELRFLYWAFFSKKKKPEVIVVSSLSLLTFLSGCILKKYFKCKLICEVRDIWPLTLVEAKKWSKNNIFINCLSLIEKHGYNKADIIIGSMQNLIEHIKNVSPDNAGKVHYIPMGFEPDVWSEKNNYHDFSFLDSLSQKGFFKVGYAGSMSNLDCIDEIIEAASILKNRPITFFLLGDGEQKEKFVALAEKYNLTSLYFLDRVKKSEVHSFLLHCDLLLSPWKDINSVYKYGVSPNKWIDYMLSAKPILVSLNGPHCIINEAGCGRFIKSGNPEELSETILEFSLMSRKELETMGNNGKSYLYQNLTYNILSEKYLNIIDNIALI